MLRLWRWQPFKLAKGCFGGKENGLTILETAVALALLGMVSTAIFFGLATTSKAVFLANERTTALSLAQSQTEYVNSVNYSSDGIYDKVPVPYENYDVDIDAVAIDADEPYSGIQKITVTVIHHGTPVYTLESYIR